MGKVELYEDIYKDQFSFGDNWKSLVAKMTQARIETAKKSLQEFTGLKDFKGKTFLDIGCGSGLFSLAASKLGATVISSDIDDSSIACVNHLRKKYKGDWKVFKGSVLDNDFVKSLPKADIVYSWGVLHHTGDMKKALANAASRVKPKGLLFIAIYNDFQGLPFSSKAWQKIKRFYSKRGKAVRWAMRSAYTGVIIAGLIAYRRNPIKYIKDYEKQTLRGMDFFVDIEDWMGGYPYEYAKPAEIKSFFQKRGFKLRNIKTTEREGCNEFLFKKN